MCLWQVMNDASAARSTRVFGARAISSGSGLAHSTRG